MLSLEPDVENFLEPSPLTPQGDREVRLLPLQGQAVILAGQSLGPGLWVRTIPLQFAL